MANQQSGYINGRWYWVTNGIDFWPALRDEASAGGWCNQDTWADFEALVVDAELIELPTKLKF